MDMLKLLSVLGGGLAGGTASGLIPPQVGAGALSPLGAALGLGRKSGGPLAPAGGQQPTFGGGSQGNPPGVLSLAGGGGGGGFEESMRNVDFKNMGGERGGAMVAAEPMAAPGMSPDAMAKGPTMAPIQPLPQKGNGVFDRIGSFMGSDEGKAALLRAGAAMLSTGDVGQGILTGANYVDGQKKMRSETAIKDRELGQKDRGLDIEQQGTSQDGAYKAGQLKLGADRNTTDLAELGEAMRANAAKEQLTARQQDILREYNNAQIQQGYVFEDGRNKRNAADNSVTMRGQDVTREGNYLGDARGRYAVNMNLYGQPDGGSQSTTETTNEDGSVTKKTTRARGTPPVLVETQEQYQQLAPGTRYVDSRGVPGVKQ